MTQHNQVWVKVNAPVDEGVAEIVAALNEFRGLETIESCQGDSDRWPWVSFRYGSYWNDEWRPLAEFALGFLAPGLLAEVGDSVVVEINATGNTICHMLVRPGTIDRVAQALRGLAKRYPVP